MLDTEIDKQVGDYKIKFKTSFDESESDYIKLSLTIDDGLKSLLKRFTINSDVNTKIKVGENEMGETTTCDKVRYKVKSICYNSIGYEKDIKDIVFIKELIDNGVLELNITDLNVLDSLLINIREVIKKLIELDTKYAKIEQTIYYKIR